MKKIAVLMTLLAGTGLVVADDKKAPPPMAKPTPAKELDVVKDWSKAWACTATNDAGEKVLAKLTIKRDMDNFWASMRFEAQKTKTRPGFTGQAMFGIDPVSKGWVMTGYDNMGGWINMKGKEATATAMTWEGDAANAGGKVPAKFKMTLDKGKLKFIGEFAGKVQFDHDCK